MALAALNAIPTFDSYAGQLMVQAGDPSLSAEVFREANQSQNVSQSSQSFSGAQSSNEMKDTAEISQNALAGNFKDITIGASTGALGADGTVGPRVSKVQIGGPLLGKATAGLFQNQGADQSSSASLFDFTGKPSEASNTLEQAAENNTGLNAFNDLNVKAPTNLTSAQPIITLVAQGTNLTPARFTESALSPRANDTVALSAEVLEEEMAEEAAAEGNEGEETAEAVPQGKSQFSELRLPDMSSFLSGFRNPSIQSDGSQTARPVLSLKGEFKTPDKIKIDLLPPAIVSFLA